MIHFLPINDDDPALAHSPMVRAIEKTFDYIAKNGPIGLTPSKAFKRVFVHWAAVEFYWSGYSNNELFSLNKVLNEIDFPPLMDLHDLLIALKIGRHTKGSFCLTKAGKMLIDHPGQLFGIITPFFLFEFDHDRFSRVQTPLLGNWDIYLNVLNVEAENGISGGELEQIFFGPPEENDYGRNLSSLYVQVLRPLVWVGLLTEHQEKSSRHLDGIFTKTPLWHSALQLETDPMVFPIVKHCSRDEVRYGMFAFAGLLIELVATFGLLLGSKSHPKRQKETSPPANIYEALKLKVDENGNVTTSYRELADDLGWHIKGRKPNVSRVKRQLTKQQAEGLLTFIPSPTGTKVRLVEFS